MDEEILIESKPEIDLELATDVEEEGQVIVHCSMFNPMSEPMGIRVWKETFLICNQTGNKSKLIKALNVVYQPQWELVFPGKTKRFMMLFERLPKVCTSFTFKEIINQPGAFLVADIPRNKRDVYRINLD
jgi:3',5'-cyclic AMP phosphodiesterase CpdA